MMRLKRSPSVEGIAEDNAHLHSIVSSARRWRLLYLLVLTAARVYAAFLVLGVIVLMVDWLYPLAPGVRQLFWWIGLFFAAGLGIFLERDWKRLPLRIVALDLGRPLKVRDALLNGWELGRSPVQAGVSEELVRRYVADLKVQLGRITARTSMLPGDWKRWLGIFLTALSISLPVFMMAPRSVRGAAARVYFPFGQDDLQSVLKIRPGNAVFPAGEDVPVELELAPGRRAEPELWVHSGGLKWEERSLLPARAGEFRYVFQGLTEAVSYRVRLQGRWSAVYRLTPFEPPHLISFRTEVRYPKYTGRPPVVTENSLIVRALQGSDIILKGQLDRTVSRAAALFRDGRVVPAQVSGRDLTLRFEAQQAGEFWLQFDPDAGTVRQDESTLWKLDIIPDEPPRVQVLAPAQDLLVSPKDVLPVVYEAEDDFGVSQVFLQYSVNNGAFQKVLWDRLDRSAGRTTAEKKWFLETLQLKSGDTVRYRLAARDNNTRTGPGEGTSATFTLQAASYELEHGRIEESLSEYRQALIKLLGDQSVARERVRESSPAWNSIAEKQSSINAGIREQVRRLESLVRKMEQDPLTDAITTAEHKAALEALRGIESDAGMRALSSVGARQAEAAGRAMDEVTAELERLSLLAEDVVQSQKMRALLQRQDELTETAGTMAEDLEALQAKGLAPEDQKRLGEMLAEMARLMGEIAKQIKDLPKELPEEFVNQASVKSLNFDEIVSAMSGMRDALSRGDAASALAQARAALERLQEVQKTLRNAGKDVPGGADWFSQNLRQKTSELEKRLEAIILKQEDLKTRTQGHADVVLTALVDLQKKVLSKAASRQAEGAAVFARLKESLASETRSALFGETRHPMARAEVLSAEIRAELDARQLREAPKHLTELRAHFESIRNSIARAEDTLLRAHGATQSNPSRLPDDARAAYDKLRAAAKDVKTLIEENEALVRDVHSAPSESDLLNEKEREALRGLGTEQQTVREETSALRRDVLTLSRQTALLGGRLPRRLQLAGEAMSESAEQLKTARPRAAVGSQETALKYLREGKEDLSSASQSMQQAGAAGGGSGSPSLRVLPGGGNQGAASGPVRIPRVEEYTPPKEFREEMMRGMKEKYPKEQEGIIRDYYENWNR